MLKLEPNPTFKAPVSFTSHMGQETIELEFKFRTRTEYEEFLSEEMAELRKKEAEGMPPVKQDALFLCGHIVTGWHGMDAEFGLETFTRYLDTRHGAATAIWEKYKDSLTQASRKN